VPVLFYFMFMEWPLEIVRTAIGAALGVFVGLAVARRRTLREDLLSGYAEFFASVIAVWDRGGATTAQAALERLSRATHRLELLESRRDVLAATGMLYARCNVLIAAVSGEASANVNVSHLREEISKEYWNAVEVVRARLGSTSILGKGAGRSLIIESGSEGMPQARSSSVAR
jgi:hypothetical protein